MTVITAFYHFINLPNYEEMKPPMIDFCNSIGLKGTILLAREGINSTISGERESINELYKYLKSVIGIENLIYKESFHEVQPFKKMKVNLKKEIVALGVEDLDVEGLKGEYIEPKDWDDFIFQKDVITIDTRNKYETMLGSFETAIDPDTKSFRQFPQWVQDNLSHLDKEQKIAMFCTGGIRCEKSTAYMKSQGFKNVYHLKGGILQYFEDTKAKIWNGSCFVFDERVALNKQLVCDHEIQCKICNKDLNTDDIRASASSTKAISCMQCNNHER
jgi:UPF0176 protein